MDIYNGANSPFYVAWTLYFTFKYTLIIGNIAA